MAEGGLMEAIGKGLKRGLHKESDICERKNCVVEYITAHIRVCNQDYKVQISEMYN